MFIVIRHYCNIPYGENRTALVGTYNGYEDARQAMVGDVNVMRHRWEEDGAPADLLTVLDQGEDVELYDGDTFDHENAVKWMVFDADNPIEYIY